MTMLMLPRAICVAAFAIAEDASTAEASSRLNAVLEALGSTTLLCILGSRMFFNLKEAAEHGVNVGTNWSSYSHSAIHFDEPGSGQAQYDILHFHPHFTLIPVSGQSKMKLDSPLSFKE